MFIPTHYGRVCPIETPEGPNIGLITSLSTFARVNELRVHRDSLSCGEERPASPEDIVFLTAEEEGQHVIAQANTGIDGPGQFYGTEDLGPAGRGLHHGATPKRLSYIDVSPKQIVSVATSHHPLSGARRCQPGPHGIQHAAPGGAASWCERVAAGGHWHGSHGCPGFRSHRLRPPSTGWWKRSTPTVSFILLLRGEGPGSAGEAGSDQPREVPALEPEHLHQSGPRSSRRVTG